MVYCRRRLQAQGGGAGLVTRRKQRREQRRELRLCVTPLVQRQRAGGFVAAQPSRVLQ